MRTRAPAKPQSMHALRPKDSIRRRGIGALKGRGLLKPNDRAPKEAHSKWLADKPGRPPKPEEAAKRAKVRAELEAIHLQHVGAAVLSPAEREALQERLQALRGRKMSLSRWA